MSVARAVMERSPHNVVVGEGATRVRATSPAASFGSCAHVPARARQFALQHGFQRGNILTASARERWQRWVTEQPGGCGACAMHVMLHSVRAADFVLVVAAEGAHSGGTGAFAAQGGDELVRTAHAATRRPSRC